MAQPPDKPIDPFDIFGGYSPLSTQAPDPFDVFNTDARQVTTPQKPTVDENFYNYPMFGMEKEQFTKEENDWIDAVINAPLDFARGGARGIAQTIPLLGEGVWGLLDLATNLSGNEDWLNPKESQFIKRMDELREAIGYEDSVAGKTGQALGSVLGFVGTTIGTGGAGAASRLGAGYNALKAGELTAGTAIKSLGAATQLAAPGAAVGVSEASSRMREFEKESGEDLSIADRNLAYSLGIPLGTTEILPIVRPLSILFSKITKRGLPKETIDGYMDLAKSAVITGTAEGTQEALASIGQDAIAKGVYNESQAIGESIASDFGYGGGAGAIFDLGVNLLTKGRTRQRGPDEPVEEDAGLSGEEAAEVEIESTPVGGQSPIEQFTGSDEIVLDSELVTPTEVEPAPLNEDVLTSTAQSPVEEVEAKAEALKDQTPNIPEVEQQIKQEAVRQLQQPISPELQDNLNQELELERQIQELEDADKLDDADTVKQQLIDLRAKQNDLIKKDKVPIKRSALTQTFNKPDGETLIARFPDIESTNTYLGKNARRTKNKLDITTPAYGQFKQLYDAYVTEEISKTYNNDTNEIKLNSFKDFVAQEQGSVQAEDILSQLNFRNINANDNTFKNFIYLETNKTNLKDLTGLERKRVFKQIQGLPKQDKPNTSIDEAFIKSRDNTEAFTKAQAIKDRQKELVNRYKSSELRQMAISAGVSESFIQDRVGAASKERIAQGIARQEINNQISAEENYEQTASRQIPNVLVNKVKTPAAQKNKGLQQYSVLYPDGKRIKTLVPANVETAEAKELAAQQTFSERLELLIEENKTKNVAPDASNQDFIQALTSSLYKSGDPLAELLRVAGPQVKQSRTPAAQTEQVQILKEDAPLLEVPNMKGINYQGNLYRFKDNINASDTVMNLKRIAKRSFPDADIVAVDNLFNEEGEAVAGVTLGDMIAINLETNPETGRPRFASPTDTIYHEAVHYFINNNYFSPEAIQVLNQNTDKIMSIARVKLQQENLPSDVTFEEAVAIASAYYNETKLQGRTPFEFTPGIRRFFEPIFKYFNQVAKYFTGKKYRRLEDVFDAVRTGDLYKDAVDNPKILSPPQQKFTLEMFARNPNQAVGPYKGGDLSSGMNLEYNAERRMQPLYSKTPARPYGVNDIKVSQIGLVDSRLNEAVKDTKTKSAKAKDWLQPLKKKPGRFKLAGSNIEFSKDDLLDTGLKDYLDRIDKEFEQNPIDVSISNIKDYLKTNQGIVAVTILGKNQTNILTPSLTSEKEIVNYFEKEIDQANKDIDEITKEIQSHLVNKEKLHDEFTYMYAIPIEDQASGAFHDLITNIDYIENAYKKLNINNSKSVIENNFDLIRQQLNVTTKSPDIDFSPNNSEKTNQAIRELTLNGRILEDIDALTKADPEQHLEKFLVALYNQQIASDPLISALEEIYNENGKSYGINIEQGVNQDFDEFLSVEPDSKFYSDVLTLKRLVIRRTEARARHDYYDSMLYGDNLDYNPTTLATNKTMYQDYPRFNIDTTNAKFNALQQLRAKAIRDGNVNKTAQEIKIAESTGIPLTKAVPSARELIDFQAKGTFNLNVADEALDNPQDQVVQASNHRELLFTWNPTTPTKKYYTSPHYQDAPVKNLFASARISDVQSLDDNGNVQKLLYIEEIQSDMYADVMKAIKYFQEELNDGDPRKNNINNLTEDDVLDALMRFDLTSNMTAVPLIGFPKPNMNKWVDFVMKQLVQLQVNEGYDGIAMSTTAIQAERNSASLQDQFNFISFYPSVNPKNIEVNNTEDGGIEIIHTPSNQKIRQQVLINENYFTPIEQRNVSIGSARILAAAQYFADTFSKDTNSYEFKQYVDHARLVGMTSGLVNQDITLPLEKSDTVYELELPETNYLNQTPQDNYKKGSVQDILPKNIYEIISGQILKGIRSDKQRADVNLIAANEYIQSQQTDQGSSSPLVDTQRIQRNVDRQPIGAGYINFAAFNPNEMRQFFTKDGWEIYDRDYVNALKKAYKDVYDVEVQQQGSSVQEAIEEIYGGQATQESTNPYMNAKVTVRNVLNQDFHAQRLYGENYAELLDNERFTVDEVIERTRIEINNRRGTNLLTRSAFKQGARLLNKGAPTKKHQSRFKVPVFTYDGTEKMVAKKVYKYSSTPADAQRANIWKRATDFLGNLGSTKYFSGLGGLPEMKEYMKLRYITGGRIREIERVATKFYDDLKPYLSPVESNLTEQQIRTNKKQLNAYMEGGKDADVNLIADTKLRKIAEDSKKAIDKVGVLLVNNGLLPQSKFEENRGSYLPRLYMKHILNNPSGERLAYLRSRKDLSEEASMILGDIQELSPEYRILKGIERPLRDMQILDFFNEVSKNKKWAIRDGDMLVDIEQGGVKKKVSALWMLEEASRLREQANYFREREPAQADQMEQIAKGYEEVAGPVAEALNFGNAKPLNELFVRIPTSKHYGALRGVAVRKEIYDDIIGTYNLGDGDNAFSKAIATMEKGTSIWKLLKVPLNPPTVVRNIGSNMILMNLVGGIPIHKVMPRMVQAMSEIRNNGKHWKIAQKYGIEGTAFTSAEMYKVEQSFIDLLQENHPMGSITRFFDPRIATNKLFKKAGDVYQWTESVGKTAIIIDAMERQNLNEFDSFLLAQKALFDYSDVPKAGKLFRKAPIGMPFFTFYYKAFPALVETAINHPFRFAPYIALSAGLTALTAYAFGFEDDEEEKLVKRLAPYLRDRTGVYPLPYKDSDGRYQFIDIGYFFPWTMYTDLIKDVSNGRFSEAQRTTGFLSGPFSDIFLALKTNRDPFTQRTIWEERDPVQDRIMNILSYTWSLGMPSWITPNGAISKTVNALQDIPRTNGSPADTVPQALLRFVGVNVYGLDTEETVIRNIKQMKQEIENIKQRHKYRMSNESMTAEEREAADLRYYELLMRKMNELQQYQIDTAIPKYILDRQSKFQDG